MSVTFMICRHCGNLVDVIENSGVPMLCCGQPMERLAANTAEASGEKHIPVVKREGDTLLVDVGAAAHPMTPEHAIEWVCVETASGCLRKTLQPGQAPRVTFCLGGEAPVAVYAYCNLHGLWSKQL